MKIQHMKNLIAEMREVARGETPASADAALPSVNRLRLSFVFSRRTTAALSASRRNSRPQSIAELARLTNRAKSNLLRTLDKLEAFGLLEMRLVDRRRVPTPTVGTLHVDIDPYAMSDRIEYRPST